MAILWFMILAVFTIKSEGAFKRERLEVKYGKWERYPLTFHDAKKQGWSIDASCKDRRTHFFKGYRYVKNNDNTTRLLFDCQGRIAGIQATLTPPSNYPTRFNSGPWYKNKDGTISATAYFRDPKRICSCKKMCASGVQDQSLVGDRIWIQQGDVKDDKFMEIPLHSKDMNNTPWVEGNCFPQMGVHYHYNISKSFDCDYAQPVFLIVSKQTGDVHGFGWGVPFLVDSDMWEKPRPALFARSVKPENLPACIANYSVISVQHVYFVDGQRVSCF